MPYVSVDDFKLGMDTRKPRVSGIPGSLVDLKNGHITRGGHIQRAKKFVSRYVLPVGAGGEALGVGRFSLTGGSASAGVNQVASVTVNGVEVLSVAVDWATTNAATATAVAAQITTFTSSPNYTSTASGETITVTAVAGSGSSPNGLVIGVTIAGDVTVSGDPYFTANTVLILSFDGTDGGTSATDLSETPHTGIAFNGSAQLDTAQKKFGSASLLLNGITDYVEVDDSADWDFGSGEWTAEAWIRFSDVSAKVGADLTDTIASIWYSEPGPTNEQFQWLFRWHSVNQTLDFFISTNGTNSVSVGSAAWVPVVDTWYHVACDRDASDDVRIYIDGAVKTTVNNSSAVFNVAQPLVIGARATSPSPGTLKSDEFRGRIDDFKITKGKAIYAEMCNAAQRIPIAATDDVSTIANARMDCGVDGAAVTFGLHAQGGNLYTFGGFAEPSGMPSGVTYQRLAHKDNPATTQISSILDTENFDGKIYAIAEFTDGTIYHYYDGARVTAWDNIAATVSSNDTVASSLKTKIDLDPDFAATVVTNVVTIEAAVAGVGFTIAATAQNFGAVNDQVIDLVQTVANDTGGAEVLSTGTVTITGGTDGTVFTGSIELVSGGGGSVDTLTVNGVDAMDGTPVAFNGTLEQTATDVATEINGNTTSPNYTAVAVGAVVSVSSIAGVHPNPDTFAVAGTATTISLGNEVALTGGTHNMIEEIKVDGVLVNDNHVPYDTSNSTTAAALATEIGNTTSSPNYTAAAVGNVVTITAIAGTGSGPNGFVVSRTVEGDLTAGTTNMQGGSASGSAAKEKWTATITGTFEPVDIFTITLDGQDFVVQGAASATGTTALTFKKKVYSTAGSFLYFCAINNPTEWEQPAIGAGYINFSNQDSGSETLNATGIYQGNIGVFSDDVTQIEFVDVDEEANTHLHTARNTGTRAHRSVVQFGNNNLFYLDELTGVRSLQQRDSSGSPQVDDVGTPIDDHLLDFMESLTETQIAAAIGLIGPDGRYWIAIAHRIYVFSFFKSSKISAWSYYEPELGGTDDGEVQQMVRIRRDVYVRNDRVVYQYGGTARTTYPNANELELEIGLPFLDLDKSAHYKTLEGFDIGALNTFEINILVNPNDEVVESNQFTLSNITYPNAKSGLGLRSSHFAPKLVCSSAGAAELYNLAVHYHLDEAS